MLPAHKTAVHVQILKFNLCRSPVQKYSQNSMLVVKGVFLQDHKYKDSVLKQVWYERYFTLLVKGRKH